MIIRSKVSHFTWGGLFGNGACRLGNLANPDQTMTEINMWCGLSLLWFLENKEVIIRLFPEKNSNKLAYEVSTGEYMKRIIHGQGEIVFEMEQLKLKHYCLVLEKSKNQH